MKRVFNLLVISLLTTIVCFAQGYDYQPWRPDSNMGPLNFNTLGDAQHPYAQCKFGINYNTPQQVGINGSGNTSSHALITANELDPCRCYTVNGQNYFHDNYLPPLWDMDYNNHQDTVIRVGCGSPNNTCYKASQIEYWFYPEKDNNTLLVMFSFAAQKCCTPSTCSHGVNQGCGSINNPQFYIEVYDGETGQLLNLGYYPTQASQQTANPIANTNWPYSRFLAWPSGCSHDQDSQNTPDEYGITTYYWAGQNSLGYTTPTTYTYRECPSNETQGNSSSYPVQWFEYKPLAFNLKSLANQNVDANGNFVANKSVKLRIHTVGCSATAHWAYGLFTAKMVPGNIQVDACSEDLIHLSVPAGFLQQTYEWHYGYDSVDATNHFLDFWALPPGITSDGQGGMFLDPNLAQIYPYYRCEMKSYSGVPFIYEAYIKKTELHPDFTYEQDFSADGVAVQLHSTSTMDVITPPNISGGTWDTVSQPVQHVEWYVKHNGEYHWFGENVSAFYIAFTPEEIDENGMASVMLKTYAGDCVDSVEKTFPLSLVAVPEHSSDKLILYPNPTTGLVSISAKKVILSIEVFGPDGKILLTTPIQKTSGRVNLSPFEAGCYPAVIHFADGTSEQVKIIKQ